MGFWRELCFERLCSPLVVGLGMTGGGFPSKEVTLSEMLLILLQIQEWLSVTLAGMLVVSPLNSSIDDDGGTHYDGFDGMNHLNRCLRKLLR